MIPLKTILVPVDFSSDSARALDYAIELASKFQAKIHLLHSYPIHIGGIAPYGMVVPESFERDCREAATKRIGEWQEKVKAAGIAVAFTVTPVFAVEAIGEQAEEIGADLIVMGTRGLTGVKHVLLGSVAERTIRTAPCPVLTVKGAESG
ncbi:MAG: universal stress protein [Myxococcales bacterium]|nr:universal stress protein [Myxococcales bacterium]MDH5305828.1 universal stress protein [Myxococcales bacterium]MDH5565841.1 universal stress protein [Myxococcales bacterium]